MEFCFGLLQTCTPKTSWISLIFLCSMLCTWTSVECWSYYHSPTTMNWMDARAWCKKDYTDMVAIQNQEEIEHLNSWLPKKAKYYWIGIRKISDIWTWVGTNKSLTKEATNWAKGEPNNANGVWNKKVNEDCVEMYIKRDSESGKWNDASCKNLKTALCYTAACKDDSCHYGDCLETINSHKCACFEGFYGEKCEQVVQCNMEEVTVPYKGSVNCIHKYGNFSYASSCQYSCEEGYQLSMSRPLMCTASEQWSEQPPTCELVKCQVLSSPARGSMKSSDPLGPSSYQSTRVFTCDEGYVLTGSPSNTLQCEASGTWNASQPLCLAVQCPSLQQLDNGFVSCRDDADVMFSYGNTCSFSCALGYHLVGPSKVTCTSTAAWSERKPRCEAITCQNPEVGAHLITQCNQPLTKLRPNSTCSFSCEAGFELQGAHSTQCSEDGLWSNAIPTCKAIGCPAPEIPTSAQISCSPSLSSPASIVTPHPLGMVCMFSCDEGHELQGALSMECANPGQWTSAPPNCTVVQCELLSSPARGSMKSSDPLGPSSYQSTRVFTCDEGYVLTGSPSNTLQCEASGTWNASQPLCLAAQCPSLQQLDNGFVSCGDNADVMFSYGNTCSFSCALGYHLVGPSKVTCTSTAAWSERKPRCEAIGCPAPEIPTSAQISCSPSLSSPASIVTPHPLGMVCMFSCDEGHELQGALSMECANPGQWTSAPPNCTAVRCPLLEAPENGHIKCSNSEPVFHSQCSFTCNQDYLLDGHKLLTCERHGNWSTGEKPTCQVPPSPVTAIASGVATGGALLSGLSLAMWILKRLKQRASKFELNSNSDIEAPPQVYKNSIDSLI